MLAAVNPLVFDLVDRVRHSWWTIVAGVCIGLAAGTIALHYIPKKYEARTTIWLSKQQIPESVIRSTVNEDMSQRLLYFKSAVLEQPYMVELIERVFGLPASDEELRALIDWVRMNVSLVDAGSTRGGLTAFALTYRDRDPKRAAKLVNTLAELYIAQNEEFRSGRAGRTAEKIESMAADAQKRFDEIDEQVNRFKAAHRFETEDYLGENQGLVERTELELDTIRREKPVTQAKLDSLRTTLERGPVATTTDDGEEIVDPLSRRIAELQAEVDALRAQYSEIHPTLKAKKRELEDVLRQARERATQTAESALDMASLDPKLAPIAAEIKIVEAEIEAMNVKEAKLRRDLAKYNRRIRVQPQVQVELNALLSRHKLARDLLLGLKQDAEKARGSVDLEESDLGQRMEILEPAVVPQFPYSPQPLIVHTMYLALGCLVFLGPLLVRNLLRPVIRSETGFVSLSDLPMLASIPLIETAEIQRAGRWVWIKNIGLSMISAAVLVGSQLFVNYM